MRFDPQSNLVPDDAMQAGGGRRGASKGVLGTVGTAIGTFLIGALVVSIWLWRASGVDSVAAAASVLSVEMTSRPAGEPPPSAAPVAEIREVRAASDLLAGPSGAKTSEPVRAHLPPGNTWPPGPLVAERRTPARAQPASKSQTHHAYESVYAAGRTHLSRGRHAQAVAQFAQAVRLRPECADAHYKLGLAHVGAGNRAAARDQYRILEALDPNLASLLDNLVRMRAGRGRRTG